MGFIRTLAIILLIYFAFRLLARYVFPLILKSFIKKAQKNMQDQMGQFYEGRQQKEEGEITIRKTKDSDKNKGKNDSNEGDYVDFEEVE